MSIATHRVLIIGGLECFSSDLVHCLAGQGLAPDFVRSEPVITANPGVSLIFLGLPATQSAGRLSWLEEFHRLHGHIPVIVVAERGSEELAVASLRAGATDYLRHPLALSQLVSALHRLLKVPEPKIQDCLHGNCERMREVRAAVNRIASSRSTVLITGETGTGKELVAKSIHQQGTKKGQPFVCINCAAIPDTDLALRMRTP